MNTFSQAIIAALKLNPMIIDNHGHSPERHVGKVAIFTTGNKTEHLVYLMTREQTPYFSTNPLGIEKDGRVHLSRWSVGPVLDLVTSGTVEEAIKDHNAMSAAFTQWDNGMFGEIIDLSETVAA